MTSPRIWAQAGPDAAQGIARAVIDFAAQFLTEDHEDVGDILRQRAAGTAVHSPGSAANAPHKEDLLGTRFQEQHVERLPTAPQPHLTCGRAGQQRRQERIHHMDDIFGELIEETVEETAEEIGGEIAEEVVEGLFD
ncbi:MULTISPECIES: hypothetical protein [unclassified Streptomyces]|uniref:hypothetical protein n=1 Tax=unclassified Streptomyces TaxID=2593676 RepID=UPI003415A13E